MNAADMGWWKADLTTLNYECSEYISKLLGLDDSGEGGATPYNCSFF